MKLKLKQQRKINETESQFLQKINKIDKSSKTDKNEKREVKNYIRNETGYHNIS